MKLAIGTLLCLALCAAPIRSVNNKLKEVFAWKFVDYAWEKPEDREAAVASGEFVPENNLPLGLEVWKDKLFITVPRWKNGVVATLNYVKLEDDENTTTLTPETTETFEPIEDPEEKEISEPPEDWTSETPDDPTTITFPDDPTTFIPSDDPTTFTPPNDPTTITPPDNPTTLTTDTPFSTTFPTTPTTPTTVTTPNVEDTSPAANMLPLSARRIIRSKNTKQISESSKRKSCRRCPGEDDLEGNNCKPSKKTKSKCKDEENENCKKKKNDNCKDKEKDCESCKDKKEKYKNFKDKKKKKDKNKKKKKKCKKPEASANASEPRSPALIPYPSFAENRITPETTAVDGVKPIVSVFRVWADVCDRLWVMDTGVADILGNTSVVSKPRILIYNLKDDKLIKSFEFKDSDTEEHSFFANIIVDTDPKNCDKAFAYVPDLGGYGIVSYDFANDKTRRLKHNYFHFDPLAGDMKVGGVNFQWTDGVFSIALTKPMDDGFRTAYFHCLASTKEFSVSTKVLKNEDGSKDSYYDYSLVGDRGADSQSSASYIHEDTGIMFYTQLQKDSVNCWNTNKPMKPENLVEVASDNETMIFTNDLKVDREGNLWVLTDKLPVFIYRGLDDAEVNYRIFTASVKDAVEGTNCAP